jgi:hypothetical protein
MASVADYLRQQRVIKDAQQEKLIANIGSYTNNRGLLQALGQGTPEEQDKGFTDRAKGLLTGGLNILGIPGRLVQGTLLEAAGAATPEMRRARREGGVLGEIKGLISGDINTSASNLPGLKVAKGDSILERLGKMSAALAVDVATDPLSYVGAPASISRRAASTGLLRFANKEEFLTSVLSKSAKGDALIDELVEKAPVGRFANVQKELEIAADAGTPLDVLEKLGRNKVAAESLADRLSTSLFTRGRTGLLKDLEEITGSKVSALSVFKTLPEDVRGGLIWTSILGKPIKNSAGEYKRLTQGTLIPSMGAPAEAINTLRLQASVVPGNIVTRGLGGQAGDILADVKKSALGKKVDGPSRMIDYTNARDSLAQRRIDNQMLTGRALSSALAASKSGSTFVGEDAKTWEDALKASFWSPTATVDETVLPVSGKEGRNAGAQLRKDMNDLATEAESMGITINRLGTPETWSPLVLNPEARERLRRTGKLQEGINYNPSEGRKSGIIVENDPNVRGELGGYQIDPNDPNIIALSAPAYNDMLEKQALAAGKTAEEAKKYRIADEDPVRVLQEYGKWLAGAASNKRFIDSMVASGTLIQDTPVVRNLLNEWNSAQIISGIQNVSDDVRKAAESRADEASKKLAELVGPGLQNMQRKIIDSRQKAIDARDIANQDVVRIRDQFLEAEAIVLEATPRISQLQRQLKSYATQAAQSDIDLAARQRIAKNVQARLKTAQADVADKRTAEQVILDLQAESVGGAEQAYYQDLIDQVGSAADTAAAKLERETALQTRNAAELEQVKAARTAANKEGAQEIEQQIYNYQTAVQDRNNLADQLRAARQKSRDANSLARKSERVVGLEQVTAFDSMIKDAVTKRLAFKKFEQLNPTKSLDGAKKAERAALLTSAQEAEALIKKVLSATDTPFADAAKEYATEIRKVRELLTEAEFDAFRIFTNRTDLERHIGVVKAGARDEEIVMTAMGDIVTTFNALRQKVDASAFAKLTKAQETILLNSNLATLKKSGIRQSTEPSAMVSALDDAGYSIVTRSPGKQRVYATSGVNKLMEDMFKAQVDPTSFQKFVKDYLDPLLFAWKTGITIGRGPGYLINNIVGGLYMNYLGNVDVKYFLKANEAVNLLNKTVKRIEQTNPELTFLQVAEKARAEVVQVLNKQKINGVGVGDLFEDFIVRGGTNSSELSALSQQLARTGLAGGAGEKGKLMSIQWDSPAASVGEEGYRKVINFVTTNRAQEKLNNFAQNSELRLRFSAFMDGMQKYGDTGAAMDKVHLLHFDYADLTDAEQWVRRIVPFYTWTRRNVPAQLRALVMQPGKIQRFMYANEEFQNYFAAEGDESWLNQVLPEYLDTQDGFVSKFKFLDNNVGTYLRLPFEDVNKLFTVKGTPRPRELLASLGPAITTPIELLSGKDIATGRTLDALGSGKVETLGNLIPQAGTLNRILASGAGAAKQFGLDLPNIGFTEAQENKGLITALNLLGIPQLAGMSLVSVSPSGINAEVARRINSQSNKIKDLAASKKIDLDWMRAQLKAGATPEELARAIASGQGRLDPNAPVEYSTLTPEKRRQMLENLSNL